ncbi:RNA-directed DNA polymerase, eukaryota [Tanacetum coccineum]
MRMVLGNEGFDDINLRYMGGMWIMIDFKTEDTKAKFQSCLGATSWFSLLIQASKEFVIDERITWVDIEGIPLKLWSESTFNRIAAKWGKMLYLEKLDEGCLYSKRLCILTTGKSNILETFKIIHKGKRFLLYSLLNKKRNVEEKMDKSNETVSIPFPPGFTPCDETEVECDKKSMGNNEGSGSGNEKGESASIGSRKSNKIEIKRTGGSLLTVMEELIKWCKILWIISVYAPQEYAEKKMLWDYLVHVISKWDGEVIVMGDFNEVRFKNERFGSLFHAHGADAFNRFILQANLQEIPLEALTLDRYLSDHRPIMLRDSSHDYGPIPFRMYHYWFEIDGFEEMISKAWCECPIVEDFRPISLIGSLYKIIAKILANRLVGVLGDLVSEVQSAFVADRQILDGPLILNEVLQWCKAKKKQTFIFKIDFEKAYDSVRWDFLGDVLNRFGFGAKWCGWIQECLRSSRGSVLVNGSTTEEFQFYKGLKQGDPLSPFLFILVMESLHLSFKRVEDAGMFNGIKINSSMTLSHMFYADDAIFMGQWSKRNIDTLMYMLKCFERASGLSINLSKSKLMGLAVSIEKVEEVTRHIGCGILNTPFSFLGSKVGGCMSRIKSWDEVIDKMVNRLSKWKMKTLSIGGRLTLLKAVFGSMPIYHMSIFKVPMLVLQRMESIRCHFFNGNDLDSKRSIWVSWNKVLTSKEKGGLGVSSLFALNRALMFKWVWRFFNQSDSLWVRVIHAIHGVDGRIGRAGNVGPTSDLIGNGSNTSFWKDRWRGEQRLKEVFPRIYALEVNKHISVAFKFEQTSLSSSLRRMPRSGIESEQWDHLLDSLEGVMLSPSEDRWSWDLNGSGEFSVASARRYIDNNRLPDISSKNKMD